jgi:hypothetical protein
MDNYPYVLIDPRIQYVKQFVRVMPLGWLAAAYQLLYINSEYLLMVGNKYARNM